MSNFFKGSGSSVAPKPECDITKPSSRIAFNSLLTSSCSSPFPSISLGARVGISEELGNAINQVFWLYDHCCPAGSGRENWGGEIKKRTQNGLGSMQRSSSTKSHLPPKGVFHCRSFSTKGRLPRKVVFQRKLSST